MTKVRALTLASALTAVSVLMTACSSASPAPSDLVVPEVVWPQGEPSGEFEDTVWVEAVREAEKLSSVAWNNLDYSDPALIEAWGYDSVMDTVYPEAEFRFEDLSSDIRASPDDPLLVDMGPLPMFVTDVVETHDGATVTACTAFGWDALYGEVDYASFKYYHVTDPGGPNHRIIEESAPPAVQNEDPDDCLPELLPPSVFDPEPVKPTDPDVELVPPAPPEAYGLEPRPEAS